MGYSLTHLLSLYKCIHNKLTIRKVINLLHRFVKAPPMSFWLLLPLQIFSSYLFVSLSRWRVGCFRKHFFSLQNITHQASILSPYFKLTTRLRLRRFRFLFLFKTWNTLLNRVVVVVMMFFSTTLCIRWSYSRFMSIFDVAFTDGKIVLLLLGVRSRALQIGKKRFSRSIFLHFGKWEIYEYQNLQQGENIFLFPCNWQN